MSISTGCQNVGKVSQWMQKHPRTVVAATITTAVLAALTALMAGGSLTSMLGATGAQAMMFGAGGLTGAAIYGLNRLRKYEGEKSKTDAILVNNGITPGQPPKAENV